MNTMGVGVSGGDGQVINAALHVGSTVSTDYSAKSSEGHAVNSQIGTDFHASVEVLELKVGSSASLHNTGAIIEANSTATSTSKRGVSTSRTSNLTTGVGASQLGNTARHGITECRTSDIGLLASVEASLSRCILDLRTSAVGRNASTIVLAETRAHISTGFAGMHAMDVVQSVSSRGREKNSDAQVVLAAGKGVSCSVGRCSREGCQQAIGPSQTLSLSIGEIRGEGGRTLGAHVLAVLFSLGSAGIVGTGPAGMRAVESRSGSVGRCHVNVIEAATESVATGDTGAIGSRVNVALVHAQTICHATGHVGVRIGGDGCVAD